MRVLLSLAFLVAVVAAAGALYVRTDSFARLLKSRVSNPLAASIRGEITLGEIDTSRLGVLIIHGLSIKYRGVAVVRITRLKLGYSLIPLLWHEARIEVIAVDPAIDLRRETDGEWNLMEALASKSPAAAGSSAFTIHIAKLDVREGLLDLAPRGPGGPRYRIEAVALDASISIAPAGVKAELSELRGRVAAPGLPPMDLYAAFSYSDGDGPTKVNIGTLRLTTQASTMTATGSIRDVGTLASDVAITIDNLAPSDLSSALPKYPLRQDVRGRISLTGDAKSMHTVADLVAGDARLKAEFKVNLAQGAPHFDGDLSLTRLDLQALALRQKLVGILDLTVKARGDGTDLPALAAKTRINIEDLRAGATNVGNVELVGEVRNGKVQFNGNLSRGPERLKLSGTTLVIGKVQYDIVAETEHLNAAGIAKSAPVTDLNSRTVIRGNGIDTQTIDARIDFRATDSTVVHVPVQSEIRARIKAGRIDIGQANVLSQGTTVSLNGSAGFAPGAETRLFYRVRADRIAPWLKLAATVGEGSVAVDGGVSGTLRGAKGPTLRAQGKMDLRSVRLPNVNVARGSASYDFAGIGYGGWPRGNANAHFTALEMNGIKLRVAEADARIDGRLPPQISIAMTIHDEKNNADRVAATLVYQPKRIVGSLDQLSLMLPDGTWHLTQSARFSRDEHHIALVGFALANGVRHLTLDASIGSTGAQKAALRAHAIDLAALQPLISPKQRMAGDLSAEIMIGGTSAAPSIEANFAVNRLELNNQRLGEVNATAAYKPSTAALDMTLHQDQSHQLRLSGSIPVNLDWSDGVVARIGNNQRMRMFSAGMRLAPFAGVAPRALRNAAGLLRADLELTGQPFHPMVNGTIAITGAGGDIIPIGVTVTDVEIRLVMSPDSIEIAGLSARAGDGTLNGRGSIGLRNNYSPGAINATLQIHRWPAIATVRYNARIDGEINASGTLEAPRIEGQIAVGDTTVHPDLDFLAGSSVPPRDETIVVIRPEERIASVSSEVSSRTPEVSSGRQGYNQTFTNLVLDVKVDIHRNNWIRHENAQVELDGNLDIRKRKGGPISIVGEIETVRGWLRFHDKRFTLASGQILFMGGSEIDPTLNIDAQYAVSGYNIDVMVAGTASKPEIKLQSQPRLAQADILSLVLFGTTTSQLGQGQKAALRQQARSMAVGAAGQALSESLGLGSLGVSVSGESVGLGRYLNENTYVAFSPNLGTNGSPTPSKVASIEYFLRRWLTISTATMSDGSRQIFLKMNKRY